MKNLLFGTTALTTAGLLATGTAYAEGGIKLGLGGYMNNYFSVGDTDQDAGGVDDFNETGLFSDGEVWFVGETTLDNGLTFGANIQLESFGDTGDTIDEDFGYMEGGFGRFQFGSENTAAYLMQFSSPSVGVPVNSGWVTSFVPQPAGHAAGFRSPGLSTFIDTGNDENTLTYFTPRMFGFQLGVSYQASVVFSANGKNFPVQADEESEFHDGVSVGVNFVESFGGVDLAVSGGYRRAESGDASVVVLTPNAVAGTNNTGTLTTFAVDDIEQFSGGLNIGVGGFTFGGSFAAETSGRVTAATSTFGTASGVFSIVAAGVLAPAGAVSPGILLVDGASFTSDAVSSEGYSWDAGVSYGTGPWTFGVMYFHGEIDGQLSIGGNDEMDAVRGAVEYAVGPGITASLSGLYADWTNDSGLDSDGFVGVVGVNFGF